MFCYKRVVGLYCNGGVCLLGIEGRRGFVWDALSVGFVDVVRMWILGGDGRLGMVVAEQEEQEESNRSKMRVLSGLAQSKGR